MSVFKDALDYCFESIRLRFFVRNVYSNVPTYDTCDKVEIAASSSDKSTCRMCLIIQYTFAGLSIFATVAGVMLLVLGLQSSLITQQYLLPQLKPTTMVTFQPDYAWWNMTDPQSIEAWEQLGGNNTSIWIKEPSRFDLAPGIEYKDDIEVYMVSVFHQFHCLKTLRAGYALLATGKPLLDIHHIDHCFDYLRQAIQCSSDMSLEKAKVDLDGRRRITEGWGTAHRCKDWTEVQHVMADYRYKYSKL